MKCQETEGGIYVPAGILPVSDSGYLIHEGDDNVEITVMILSFQTDMPGQTVQTQIRQLLEEQSDQGLHYLPFHLHRLDSLLYGRAIYTD